LPARGDEAPGRAAMSRRCRDAPARLDRARGKPFRRPQQQQGPPGLARGEAQPLALLQIEGTRENAGGDLGRPRMQGFLDRPQSIEIVARFDQSDAAGIEAERLHSMAIKLAGGGEARHRGDDEEGLFAGRYGRHEAQEKSQCCRLVLRAGGMDLMDAVERQAVPGEMPVER